MEGVEVKRMYTVTEAANYLGISPQTIYNGLSRDSKQPFPIKPKRFGRKPLFDKADLDLFVENLPQ